MATFKTIVKNKRADGYYKVYIRVTQGKTSSLIPTDKLIAEKHIKKGEITHQGVLIETAVKIKGYIEKLVHEDTEGMTASEIKEFLTSGRKAISFSDYCRTYYERIYNNGRDGSAKNYKYAINRLQEFSEKKNLLFSDITSNLIMRWIESMKDSKKKKSSYPKAIKAMFASGQREYNDYDRNKILIPNNPFKSIIIPCEDLPETRAITIGDIKAYFKTDISSLTPPKGSWTTRAERAKDVCMLVFCLAGINTADLYDLKKDCLKENWLLCYHRKKTRNRRKDKAYTEITVPEIIRPVFKKYMGGAKEGYLFSFNRFYSTSDGFNQCINLGIEDVCKLANIERISSYVFRHSWATIAANNLGASIGTVGLALVHQSSDPVTSRYIKKDFSVINKINKKVLKKVFG